VNILMLKQRQRTECNWTTCKDCPFFVLKDSEPTCTHKSAYLLDCKLLFSPPGSAVPSTSKEQS
jgi:hypothetical protein